MKAYLDTNILIDAIIPDRPGNYDAITILEMARLKQLDLFISTQSILDAAYITNHSYHIDGTSYRMAINRILKYVDLRSIGSGELLNALKSPGLDLEDNAQAALAGTTFCHIIISNDKDFFLDSDYQPISVMSSSMFVNTCKRLESAEPQMG